MMKQTHAFSRLHMAEDKTEVEAASEEPKAAPTSGTFYDDEVRAIPSCIA
jgi:hypothetical protein